MSAPRWIVDSSRAPVILLRVPGKVSEPPDFEALIEDVDALLGRKERIVVIQDLTNARPDAERRRRLVDWMKTNSPAIQRFVVGYGLVAPTAFHRGLIVATKWFIQPMVPTEVFATLSAAIAWGEGLGREAGLLVRPE